MASRRVSRSMKGLGLFAAALAIAALAWILRHPARARASDHRRAAAGAAIAGTGPRAAHPETRVGAAAGGSAAAPGPVADVTRLASAEERRDVADRIARAHAARGAIRARPLPRLPDPPPDDPGSLRVSIRDAMREAAPDLAGCYTQALPTLASPDLRITAQLTLTGDPDVGTLIDAKQLFDHDGKPLPAALDDCLRSRFQELELPPLAEGDQVEVHYPFVFSKGPDAP